jgi:hypothetical protein
VKVCGVRVCVSEGVCECRGGDIHVCENVYYGGQIEWYTYTYMYMYMYRMC